MRILQTIFFLTEIAVSLQQVHAVFVLQGNVVDVNTGDTPVGCQQIDLRHLSGEYAFVIGPVGIQSSGAADDYHITVAVLTKDTSGIGYALDPHTQGIGLAYDHIHANGHSSIFIAGTL